MQFILNWLLHDKENEEWVLHDDLDYLILLCYLVTCYTFLFYIIINETRLSLSFFINMARYKI